MQNQAKPIHLTPLQISHTVIAIQDYMQALLHAAEHDAQGGEHEDYLIAQSILQQLTNAKE